MTHVALDTEHQRLLMYQQFQLTLERLLKRYHNSL